MQNNTYRYTTTQASASYNEGLRQYMLSVYRHMSIGLAITGFSALILASSPSLMKMIFGTPLAFVVMLAPLGFVFFFNFKLNSISSDTARKYFWIFSVLMGISLSSVFAIYTGISVIRAFFITSASFAGLTLYGYTTKKDLSGFGSFLIMGLFGIIIASLVNMFLKSSGLDFAISAISVFVFAGLTAYDTQRIKSQYDYFANSDEAISKVAIVSALSLYMDFINLFLTILRFVGDRKN